MEKIVLEGQNLYKLQGLVALALLLNRERGGFKHIK
jgi:hypothetical protein